MSVYCAATAVKSKQDLRQSALIRAIAFFLNATSDRLNLEEWINEHTEPEEPAD
ncbi:hypothetical protein [Nostoc sp.]|uniref:hypothetical protein n=1 Tax=Nostoc sp. TaxID=1180 RepID=UPI002FF71BCD